MLQSQENKATMWAVVIAHLDSDPTVWNTIPALLANVNAFKTKRDLIAPYLNRQQQKTIGVTKDKKKLEDIAVHKALPVIANIEAYARDNNDHTLFQNIHITKSALSALPDTELAIKLQSIHDTATTLLPLMANYGNTAATLATFQTVITDYATAIPKPRATSVQKQTATTAIRSILADGTALLKRIDNLMLNFEDTHPDYHSDYLKSREIIDLAQHHTRLQLTITNSLDSTPIYGATVIITDSDCGGLKTDLNGQTSTPIPKGIYTATISHPDYQDLIRPLIQIKKGKTTHLQLQLIPL